MRKLNLKLMMVLIAAISAMLFSSCDDKTNDPVVNEFLPVLNENFAFIVDGNNVNFTTTMSGNVLVTTNEVEYAMVDKKVTVNLPNKGTYSFTCSSLGSGAVLTSAAFDVMIGQDDLAFLDEGLWKFLSGGANKTKTWRMDINANAESVYFTGPLYYSGYSLANTPKKDEWSYWAWDVLPEDLPVTVNGVEQTSLIAWAPDYAGNTWLMAAKDYGTITFDATNKTASTTKFGATVNGTFTFDPETMKLGFGGGIILPIDTARINEPQFLAENLANLRIFSLTEESMQIGIKRSYDGIKTDEAGVKTHPEDTWVMIYNFVVDGRVYEPETLTYTEPINTSFVAADLVGTWKYAEVPFAYVAWTLDGSKGKHEDAHIFDDWATAAALIATEWVGISQAQLDVTAAVELVFNNDGTCTIDGISTTYSVASGVITFGEEMPFKVSDHWSSFNSTTVSVLNIEGLISGGIYIGAKNGTKNESNVRHIIKQ